jgi:hypothetical protein
MLTKLLLLTGSSFSFLFIFYSYMMPIYLATILFFQSILTLLFWYDPIKNKNTYIHLVDGINAKIVILSFIFYKFFIYTNNLTIFSITTSIGLYFFYLSHISSKEKWCCNKHLICHSIAHILSVISIYLAIL